MVEYNIESTHDLSKLLFGGIIKEGVIEPKLDVNGSPLLYKTGPKRGQIKTRKVRKERKINGLGLKPLAQWKTKREGIYSTDDDVLTLLAKKIGTDAGTIASLMLSIRDYKKQLSTYFNSIEDLIYPDSCIHPSFIHVQNETSRLACRNPNVQNQPTTNRSKAKQHFTSRWGRDGCIIEVDFHQQEPMVSAQLSGDVNLIADITNQIDLYCKYLAKIEQQPYEFILNKVKQEQDQEWITKRQQAKIVILAGNYGAGVKTRAFQSGLSEERVKELMEADTYLYPQLQAYNNLLLEFVNYTSQGAESGYYSSPFGKRYYFTKESAPEWLQKKGVYSSFRPTKIKNYIIQGTATDITMIGLGKLYRAVSKHRDKFLLINTVHDSIVLDCKTEYMHECCDLINNVLNSIKDTLKCDFNLDWVVPIRWEIKKGENWYSCKA